MSDKRVVQNVIGGELVAALFGVLIGTGVGGLQSMEEQVEIRLTKGERRVSPFTVPMMMPNAAGAAISMRYGLRGPNETITTACAASPATSTRRSPRSARSSSRSATATAPT